MTTRAIVSIHDVEPRTLPAVLDIVDMLRGHRVGVVTLLVVPGVEWPASDVDTIRGLAQEGCRLAGHGWVHQAPRPRGLWHRVHAALLSRDQAEHLSRDREELRGLVARCHAWFTASGLPSPELYVPPAWALGRLSRADLRALPFRWYATLTGCIDAYRGTLRPMALVGYEADNLGRKVALRMTNLMNKGLAHLGLDPLRIAIHPNDLGLRLSADIPRILDAEWEYTTMEAVMEGGPARTGPTAAANG